MFAVKTMAKKYDNCKVLIILSCNTHLKSQPPACLIGKRGSQLNKFNQVLSVGFESEQV